MICVDPKKQRALVEYLMRQDRPVTAKELADFLNFSVRTVKSYISDINRDEKRSFVLSSHRGYEVNTAEAEQYLRRHRSQLKEIPQSYEERAAYINRKFLTYHTDRLELYDLSDELCYSVETIRADFQKMNRSFSGLGIAYELHGDYAVLRADEQSLRKLARYTLLGEVPGQIVGYGDIREAFSDVNVDAVKLLLEQALREHDFYVNDFGMLNLVMHLCIIIRRLKSNNVLLKGAPLTPDAAWMEYIEARSESQVPQYYGKFEYLLLGPYFVNQLPNFQALGEKHGFKAEAIPPKIYGALDAKGLLELIRSMAE